MKKIKIFVDMDATLAEWKKTAKFEDLYKKDYFKTLKPHFNLIEALNELIKDEKIEVYVLSAYLIDSKYALKEKNIWLDQYFNIPKSNRLFLPCGENKNIYCDGKFSLLIDDYNLNLNSWKGTKIKFCNGINDVRGTFEGLRITSNDTKDEIVQKIKSLF